MEEKPLTRPYPTLIGGATNSWLRHDKRATVALAHFGSSEDKSKH
jgi:hypothetical protein